MKRGGDLARLGNTVVVTDWVVAETGNGLARSSGRRQFATALDTLQRSPRTNLIFITDKLLQRSIDLYAQRDDKTWGLVDCASFVVMQDEKIREAFTNDRHFDQAGFTCLISEE